MSLIYFITGAIVVILFIYLFIALLKPEIFN